MSSKHYKCIVNSAVRGSWKLDYKLYKDRCYTCLAHLWTICKKNNLKSAYSALSLMLSSLYAFSHIFKTTLWSEWDYHPLFTDEESHTWDLSLTLGPKFLTPMLRSQVRNRMNEWLDYELEMSIMTCSGHNLLQATLSIHSQAPCQLALLLPPPSPVAKWTKE